MLAVRVPVLMQLRLLPDALKKDSIHAAFPSIMGENSLCVPYSGVIYKLVEPFWTLVVHETGLTKLQCTPWDRPKERDRSSVALLKIINKLTGLGSLSVPAQPLRGLCLTEFLRLLSCQKSLKHFNISDNQISRAGDDASEFRSVLLLSQVFRP